MPTRWMIEFTFTLLCICHRAFTHDVVPTPHLDFVPCYGYLPSTTDSLRYVLFTHLRWTIYVTVYTPHGEFHIILPTLSRDAPSFIHGLNFTIVAFDRCPHVSRYTTPFHYHWFTFDSPDLRDFCLHLPHLPYVATLLFYTPR